jgi:hypothetical protein
VTIRGIAPNVKIINFHALGPQGKGTDSSVIKAINKAIALKSQYNIRVMNLSLGRPVYESYVLEAGLKKPCIWRLCRAVNIRRPRYLCSTGEQWVDADFHVPESLTQVSLQMTVRARCLPLMSAS